MVLQQLGMTSEKEESMACGTDRSSWGRQCSAAGYGRKGARRKGEKKRMTSAGGGSDQTPEAYTLPCRGKWSKPCAVGRGAAAGAATQQSSRAPAPAPAPAPANRHDPRHARYSAAYCAMSLRVHGPDFVNLPHVPGTTTRIFV
jgi:hypothetical protein